MISIEKSNKNSYWETKTFNDAIDTNAGDINNENGISNDVISIVETIADYPVSLFVLQPENFAGNNCI